VVVSKSVNKILASSVPTLFLPIKLIATPPAFD
jgi:hypothetical protein